MFSDPDTYWHLATGDLIRSTGTIPEFDSWSYSAGQKHWYITSWGWDVLVSYAYAHFGWHGVIVFNSITIAATLAVLFATCLLVSREGLSAFLATLLVVATLFDFGVRPHQFGMLCIALLMLLLTLVDSKRLSRRWLFIIPALMVLWVNMYGGFVIGFFLMGFFGLEALINRNWHYLKMLTFAGVLSLLACLLNPTGIMLVHDLLNIGRDSTKTIIYEWQPMAFSLANLPVLLYILLFVTLVMARPLPLPVRQRWVSYIWLAMSIYSTRHIRIFAIVSAPLLALGLNMFLSASSQQRPVLPMILRLSQWAARMVAQKRTALFMGIVSVLIPIWLFSSSSTVLYGTGTFNPLPDLSGEIRYIKEQQPNARLLNSYNLGGPLIFLTRGSIPVWIDGRVGTAYPLSVLNDYITFHQGADGWEQLFPRYRLDGVIIQSSSEALIRRFKDTKGWKKVYQGRTATIFMLDRNLK